MTGITPKYELKIIIDPPTSGKVDGAGKYAEGKEVHVNATAFEDWEFVKWSGDRSDPKPTFSIVLDRNLTITAHFKKVAKPIDRLTILSGVILLLSIFTTVCLYIIIDRINKTEQKTGSTIVSESKSLDQKIELLTKEQNKMKEKLDGSMSGLNQKIESLTKEQSSTKEKLRALTSAQISVNNKLDDITSDRENTNKIRNSLASSNVQYELWSDELTTTQTSKSYTVHIGAGKNVQAYLSGMTADGDLHILNPNNSLIASSGRATSRPDAVDFTTSSAGTYTFKVYNQPTKYKLEVYVRN